MGTWGYKNFENDTAFDYLNAFIEYPDIRHIEDVFDYILEKEDFLDSEGSSVGLACAEIILNQLEPDNKENIPDEFYLDDIKLIISKELIKSAIATINKILHFDKHSELRELWIDSDSYEDWVEEQNRLLKALNNHI